MFIPLTFKKTAFRYERKFPVKFGLLSKIELEWQIKTNNALFSEIYEKRQINSIYLDTNAFDLYNENLAGQAKRFKFRIRWYGDDIKRAVKPKLEVKIKYGLTGDKWIYSLPDFNVDEIDQQEIIDLAKNGKVSELITEQLHFLYPVLLNTYERRYYLSADKKFRLTFDENMNFYRYARAFGVMPNPRKGDTDFVIELKYNPEDDIYANRISKLFPFRMDKFSKYVTGCDFFYNLNL